MHNQAISTSHATSSCTIRQSQPLMLSMHNQAVPTSHALNAQSGSPNLSCSQCTIRQSQPLMLSMHNQAVPNLSCSQCTIMQSQPPMLSMHNQAVPTSHALNVQSCMQSSCSLQCIQSTFTNVEHLHELQASCKPPLSCTPGCTSICDCPPQVSGTPLWNWELLQVAKHLRKKDREETCKLPMYYSHQVPEYLSCS